MARAKLLLQEIETYAQNIGDTIRDPILILDRDLCVKSANRAFYKTFQALPEDTEGCPIQELGDGQWNIPSLLALLRDILPTKGHFDDIEVTHDFPKIGIKTMLLNARKLYRPGNRTVLLVLAIEDITERKRTERALAENEEHFRTLYETMAQGVLYQNATGTLISANPAAQRLLGLPIDEMAGRVSADPRWKAVHEDGTAFASDDHPPMRALRTGQPVLGVAMGVFNPRLNEMRWLRVDSVPQFHPGEDRPYQVYSTFEDITERKQAAEIIRVSEQRYRRLFEMARDGILLLDSAEGRITDANPFMSELLGYSHAEMIGKQLWEIGLLQDKEASLKAFRRLRQENYIRYENLPLRTQRGERREVEFVSNLYHENGHTVIQCNIRDITEHKRVAAEHKRVAAELAAAVAQQGRQAAVLGERDRLAREIHDTLAQGFTGIITQMEAAEAALANMPEPVSVDRFAVCQAQVAKVQVRIEKSRDLARESLAEARRFVAALRSPLLEASPLSEVLARFLVQRVLGTVTEGHYTLEGVPYALPVRVEHCLLRIGQEAIANAVDHAQAQEISVELSFETGRVRLRVRDDGHGFDAFLPDAGHYGLRGMEERAEKVQGILRLKSYVGTGTTIDLIVPVVELDAQFEPQEGTV